MITRFATIETLYLKTLNIANIINWTLSSYIRNLHLEEGSTYEQIPITQLCLPPSLETLTLHKCLNSLKIANSLPRDNLRYLDMSCNVSIKGTLTVILRDNFPSLKTMILRSCELELLDLSSLAQANVTGRLPKLRHLDISSNGPYMDPSSLFDFSCEWNQLQSLNIMSTGLRPHLHLATVTSLRHRCDVAPKSNQLFWCCIVTPSDCDVTAMSLGNRFVSHWE